LKKAGLVTSNFAQNLKIMVVEDDEGLRDILAVSLESLGYQILQAAHGKEAFSLFQENSDLDLVISDIQMAGGSGLELLKSIKAMGSGTPPVILMTGFSDVNLQQAIAAGAYTIVTKPFKVEVLVEHIQKVTDSAF
jgi:CheY-like chemotaxis protein